MPRTCRNVVVFICHDLGQHLGCYGVQGVRSANIDAFAAGNIRFKNSFCAAPQCSPSRAALWTGRFPHANGVVGLTHGGFQNDLNPDERHFAQLLRGSGFDTHLFGTQHESPSAERCGYEHIHPGGNCGDLATQFCEFVADRRTSDKPLFAQIGSFEPHRPFPHEDTPPVPPGDVAVPPYMPDIPEVREDLAEMEASIASVDKAFGRIIAAIGASDIADDTLVMFTADHGIPFTHAKMTLYDPGIQVPLILRLPGAPGNIVREEMVSNVDVVPTLLDLLDLPVPSNLHGRSFAGLLTGGGYQPREDIFAEKTYHTYYDPMRAIRTCRWKLIANFENAPWQETSPDYGNNAKSYVEVSQTLNVPYAIQYHPPFELYDLQNDPLEQRNLAEEPEHRATRDDLARKLRQWMADTNDPLLARPMAQGAYRQRMDAFRTL